VVKLFQEQVAVFAGMCKKEMFQLFLHIVRMKDVRFSGEEVQVPIAPKSLANVKEIAEHSRKRVIPQISEI